MIDIIPAIDIIEGKCVRLSKGDYDQKQVYSESPLEVAKGFAGAGCHRLHLVDLDGAKSNHIVNYNILEKIASATNLIIDFGGGIKSEDDARIAFECGASMITGGSIAIKQPDIFEGFIAKYGSECVILGADARNGKISTDGWLQDSEQSIVPFINAYMAKGIKKVISTDINCDGMLQGPSIDLYKMLLDECEGIYLIASGGVSSMRDIDTLQEINIPGVIVGKALYEGRISLMDLEKANIR